MWESVESEGAHGGRGGDILNNNLWSTEKDDGTPKDDEAPDIGLIFGCLPPPTPNKSQPHATRNLRGYARDIEEDIKFQIGVSVSVSHGGLALLIVRLVVVAAGRKCGGRRGIQPLS